MQFGDGTFKLIDCASNDPEEAVQEARDWVADNAWFEVYDEAGEVVGEERLT